MSSSVSKLLPCLFCSCIKAWPWSPPIFINTFSLTFLRGRVLHSLPLADPLANPTYSRPFVILFRDAFQVLHCFIIPPRFDILCQCQRCRCSLPRCPRHPRSHRRSTSFRRQSLWQYIHFPKPRYVQRYSGRLKRTV